MYKLNFLYCNEVKIETNLMVPLVTDDIKQLKNPAMFKFRMFYLIKWFGKIYYIEVQF